MDFNAVDCSAVNSSGLQCSRLQWIAVDCTGLQCTVYFNAVDCSGLQWISMHSVFQCTVDCSARGALLSGGCGRAQLHATCPPQYYHPFPQPCSIRYNHLFCNVYFLLAPTGALVVMMHYFRKVLQPRSFETESHTLLWRAIRDPSEKMLGCTSVSRCARRYFFPAMFFILILHYSFKMKLPMAG